MRTIIILSALALIATALPAHAGFYTWTDRDGKEFFTNEPEKIPAEYRASARPV